MQIHKYVPTRGLCYRIIQPLVATIEAYYIIIYIILKFPGDTLAIGFVIFQVD